MQELSFLLRTYFSISTAMKTTEDKHQHDNQFIRVRGAAS